VIFSSPSVANAITSPERAPGYTVTFTTSSSSALMTGSVIPGYTSKPESKLSMSFDSILFHNREVHCVSGRWLSISWGYSSRQESRTTAPNVSCLNFRDHNVNVTNGILMLCS